MQSATHPFLHMTHILLAGLALAGLDACQTAKQDVLITHVRLIDGTGSDAFEGAVRIREGRILDVGDLKAASNDSVIDGRGLVLAPGFIDAHSHHLGHILRNPSSPATASQGITTIVLGQDGSSEPMDSLAALFRSRAFAVNIASYTGQTSLREQVMGEKELLRTATAREIEQMQSLLTKELSKGSLGLSTGLEYEGAFYSSLEEVLALAQTAAASNGRYISHLRSEDFRLDEALSEIIEIGRKTGMPVQVSHIKIADKMCWGQAGRILSRMDSARQQGIDITADVYPYTYWNSTLKVLFPDKQYKDIRSAALACQRLFDADSSMLARFRPNTTYEGRMIADLARERRETPAATLLHLIAAADKYRVADPDADDVEAIAGKSMLEADVRAFTQWKHSVICSDGNAGRHPRGYGSFPRVLGLYVREAGLMRLEEAIHKMTGLTAKQLGIQGRGLIQPGQAADLVLFDPNAIIDHATLQDSHALSTGIHQVWVNGGLVFQDGQTTGQHTGALLKR